MGSLGRSRGRRFGLAVITATYAHVDPVSAYPQNDFVDNRLPFLKKAKPVPKHRRHHGGRGDRDDDGGRGDRDD